MPFETDPTPRHQRPLQHPHHNANGLNHHGGLGGQTSNKARGQAIHNGSTNDCSPFGLDKLHFDHFAVDDYVPYSSHEIIDISCETLVAEPSDHFVPSTAAAELG